MANLTDKEAAALRQIEAACKAYGGETWAEAVQDYGSLRGKPLAGAISALARKGVVSCVGTGRDQVITVVVQ